MSKGLTRAIRVLLLSLFLGGTILLPSFHRAQGSGNHAMHDARNCAVCQLASTPGITTAPAIAPIREPMVAGNADILVSTVLSASLRDATQARAPPVA